MPGPATGVGGNGRSPLLRKQLDNLEKDAESRKSAMKVLKSFVEDLDSKSIPLFLTQVSQENGPNLTSREYTISLYEVLARFHGPEIVPHIDNIMLTIVTTLKSSAGSIPLQQACSKVVPAIARYGIEPSTPEQEKAKIIYSLCKPLSDLLINRPESAASGSALCLKALVESENWRFASNEIVVEVCLRVVGALKDGLIQTNSHMGLTMTLAARNSLVIEAYAGIIIQSAIRMLRGGGKEVNLHRRLTAIQMVNCLMKCVDMRSISSELEDIIDALENCDLDQMECVRGAASEALHTAKSLCAHISQRKLNSVNCFNTRQTASCQSCTSHKESDSLRVNEDGSPGSEYPESQTVDSFLEEESVVESPLSSFDFEDSELTRRRLLESGNGGVDMSHKDGLMSEAGSSSDLLLRYSEDALYGDEEGKESLRSFSGYDQMNHTSAKSGSSTSSWQTSLPESNIDDADVFATPRKFMDFIQDEEHGSCESSEKQSVELSTPRSSRIQDNIISGSSGARLKRRRDKSRLLRTDVESFKPASSMQCILSEAKSSELSASFVVEERGKFGSQKGFNTINLAKGRSILMCCVMLAIIALVMLELQTESLEKNFVLAPT